MLLHSAGWPLGSTSDFTVADALSPDCQWGETPPDAVIMNPPWGGKLSQSRKFYKDNGYSLAFGQFDIFDLFVERALTACHSGALLGLILPDAVFQPEHRGLRQMLLQHTLLLVARLGEGIFEDVYRSTVVVVLRLGAPRKEHSVQCLQVPSSQRRLVRRGEVSFKEVKELYSHYVPQSRFADNQGYVFNIAQTELDYGVFEKFSTLEAFPWTRRVHVGRGIEIGKRGMTISCLVCGHHRSSPKSLTSIACRSCAAPIEGDAPRQTIVTEFTSDPGWHPLIVGEDVDRYSATPRRFIRLDVPGIKYKPMEHFASRKLLIRKTGVGLRAAVDETGSATIQTVFYMVTESREDEWILDYLQGIINSRPILAGT